jgi:multicomponent Na+:H+ antiporter subunit C
MSDPLPQAMVLTAIVITFGLTAFLLAVAYRSWYLTGNDEVQDDVEDRQVVRLAQRNELPAGDLGGEGPDGDPEQVDRGPGAPDRRPTPGFRDDPGPAGPGGRRDEGPRG